MSPTEQRYFENQLCLEFEAEVIDSFPLPDGRTGVVLPYTFFYPTGGGQEHDTGTIGPARVEGVYKEEDGRIIHVLSRPLTIGHYPARIDWPRRLRHMQHHTAQHVLTGSFVTLLGLETLSAHINGDAPSTIDLNADKVPASDLLRVEEYANQIVFENRIVKSYYVSDEQAASIPFRKAPAVSGRIRVIEVDGFDYSACGGTHCPQTGMVGLIKIVRAERVNQKLRIHFVAGVQALETFRLSLSSAQEAATLLDTGIGNLAEAIRRLQERLKTLESEVEALQQERLEQEAQRLVTSAKMIGRWRLVMATFHSRSPAELRLLAGKLRLYPDVVGLLASHDGQKLSLVVVCGADTGLDARLLLERHLALLGGRGGGDVFIAQGGGPADENALAALFAHTEERLADYEE